MYYDGVLGFEKVIKEVYYIFFGGKKLINISYEENKTWVEYIYSSVVLKLKLADYIT